MTKITYERETCGRCGGSGRYSFNMMDGDRCYGCGGSGKRLTKRGKAAREYAGTILERPISSVKPGDVIRFSVITMNGRSGAMTKKVAEIDEPVVVGKSRSLDGTEHEIVNVTIRFEGGFEHGFNPNTLVRFAPTEEEAADILRYQDNLTKAGKPRKRRA